VNLVLFEPAELERPLPADDPRALHITGVLGRRPGDAFDAGVVDGPRGKAMLLEATEGGLLVRFEPLEEPPPLHPVVLAFAACRPVSAQRMLREATSLGVESIWTFGADKAERGYLEASLWSAAGWRPFLLAGAMQAFSTRLPTVEKFATLDAVVPAAAGLEMLALDNYEAGRPLREWTPAAARTAVAVGPERGWSARERALLRAAGVGLYGLGERVLRSDTACLAGLALVLARRALL